MKKTIFVKPYLKARVSLRQKAGKSIERAEMLVRRRPPATITLSLLCCSLQYLELGWGKAFAVAAGALWDGGESDRCFEE